uniref:PBS lyase HEAT domain protein repeat-containing protein n=1 Tax=Solibacter usitatus (strain Ellin6076) TaxID=234267 RepID=Q027C4_SOLUE
MRKLLILTALASGCFAATAREDAWAILDKALQDDSEHKRIALAALATIPGSNPKAVLRAESALEDKDAEVRQAAAMALGQMKAREAVPYLKKALDDTGEVAFAAAKALTEIGDPSGRDVLIEVLAGERKDTPGIVTNAMRTAKNKIHHPGGLILMGAQDATGAMFGPASWGIVAAKDAVDLRGKGTPGRAAAAAYLVKDPDPYAVTLLEWALGDENQFVRAEAAKGLGQRGTSESIAKLQPLLDDPHTRVRAMAAASIINLSPGATP